MIMLSSLSEQLSSIKCESGWDSLCLDAIDHAWWGVILEILLLVYAFLGLAIICDEYLVPSLETLCVRWNVREDVAGATLLAAGSSCPELIINALTTVQGHENIELGVGAIIGSGMIAFMVIPSACSLLSNSDTPIQVKRRPLLRDIVFYTAALILLCVFFSDGEITITEASILVAIYVLYVFCVFISPKIRVWQKMRQLPDEVARSKFMLARSVSFVEKAQVEARIKSPSTSVSSSRATVRSQATESLLSDEYEDSNRYAEQTGYLDANTSLLGPSSGNKSAGNSGKSRSAKKPLLINFDAPPTAEEANILLTSSYGSVNDDNIDNMSTTLTTARDSIPGTGMGIDRDFTTITNNTNGDDEDEDDDDEHTYSPILGEEEEEEESGIIGKIIEKLSIPLTVAFKYTCPQAKLQSPWESYYPLGFLLSIVWVALFSCIISAVVGRFVTLSGVSMAFFGLVLVAFGAEIPDIVQSTSVAKKGYGSMAVSNCIGSQIINILMGLGLPWLISILIRGKNIMIIRHDNLFKASIIQLVNVGVFTVLMLVFALVLRHNKVQLSTWKAKLNLSLYCLSLGIYAFVVFR